MKEKINLDSQEQYLELLKSRLERSRKELIDLKKKEDLKEVEIQQLEQLIRGME